MPLGQSEETRGDGSAGKRPGVRRRHPFMRGTIYEITGWRRWLLFLPFAWLLRLYYATLRFDIAPDEELSLRDQSRSYLIVTWHNRSLVVPSFLGRYRDLGRISCLISPSK